MNKKIDIHKSILLIYLTSFFCGMSIMAVELSATRLLAPYFGTSQIVWTVVIGLIMVSLSLGNYFGGKAADRYNSFGRLYFMIWMAAIWIALIPLVGKYVIAGAALVLMWLLPSNLIIGGSVISCLIIFSLPLVILGMVSPYLVKLAVKDTANTGRITGKIYSVSTVGSIIGTCIPTFVTIPYIGTSKSFMIFALILNLMCVFYFFTSGEKRIRSAIVSSVTAAAMIVMLVMPLNNSYAFWKDVIAEEESLYNYLQVYKSGNNINLSTNVAFGVQSIYNPDSVLTGSCFDYFLFGPYFIKGFHPCNKPDILVLGMATGTFVKQSGYFFPGSNVDGVEIDGKIVDLAKKYFNLQDEDANIYINDGRTFLYSGDAGTYDVVLVDAYHDITVPFHMATAEFFTLVRKHLKPGGTIILNINMRSEGNNEIADYLTQTIKSVMSNVYVVNTKRQLNTIVYATDNDDCLSDFRTNLNSFSVIGSKESSQPQLTASQQLLLSSQQQPPLCVYTPDKADIETLYELGKYVSENLDEVTESRLIFRDEITPVEILGQKLLDEIVSDSVTEYKNMFDLSPEGIREFFKSF